MSQPAVEVVLINWKRPENVARIIDALRGGTTPCTITLVDNHPAPEFALAHAAMARVDRMYAWGHNLGAYSRYVPLAGYDHEFTYLPDDDMLPGARCLEHFLDHAPERFGVLGEIGRRLSKDGRYRQADVKRHTALTEVDLVVRAYFVRTRNLGHLPMTRWEFGLQGATDAEDDILLAVAMQRAGLACYLTPHSDDPETSVRREALPSPHALSDRGDHKDRRTETFARARRLGWRPMRRRPGAIVRRALRRSR